MIVTLKSYLARLDEAERGRPGDARRPVPSMDELAEAVNVHRVTLSNIANNRGELLNLRLVGRIIAHMRQLGFATDVSDILAYQDEIGQE